MHLDIKRVIFLATALFLFFPGTTGAMALMAGIGLALALGNPFPSQTKRMTPLLLQVSIVGLGAGMDLGVVGRVGAQGVLYTAVGITFTLLMGWGLGRLLKTDRETSLLISVGTAICGGSAIAAMAPVIRAKNSAVSVALATVFILNASALLFFPGLGRFFDLDEQQFGLFSALAVHDTSSVVGTAMRYGPRALEIATTVKLARALWIIPVPLFVGMLWNRSEKERPEQKAKRPWFILGFLATAALVTWVPELRGAGEWVVVVARRALVVTLFLIGSGLTRETLKSVGVRPFAQGLLLWAIVAAATLAAIRAGWIA